LLRATHQNRKKVANFPACFSVMCYKLENQAFYANADAHT